MDQQPPSKRLKLADVEKEDEALLKFGPTQTKAAKTTTLATIVNQRHHGNSGSHSMKTAMWLQVETFVGGQMEAAKGHI